MKAPLGVAIPATAHQQPARNPEYTDIKVCNSAGETLGFVAGDDCPSVLAIMDDPHHGYSLTFTRLAYDPHPKNRKWKHVGGPVAEFTVTRL